MTVLADGMDGRRPGRPKRSNKRKPNRPRETGVNRPQNRRSPHRPTQHPRRPSDSRFVPAHAHKDTHKRQPVTFEPARGAPGGVADLRTQNCRISKPAGGGLYSSPSHNRTHTSLPRHLRDDYVP